MLGPIDVEQNLRHQSRRAIPPRLLAPVLLGEEPAFPKGEAPELRLTQTEALTLKTPELLPGDAPKGLLSATSPFISCAGGGVGLAACQA